MAGNLVHLTQTEYNILAFLSRHTGKVMTYSAIIRSIWGSVDEGSVKKLQVNMANIRKKLGSRPGDNRYVINEPGRGVPDAGRIKRFMKIRKIHYPPPAAGGFFPITLAASYPPEYLRTGDNKV